MFDFLKKEGFLSPMSGMIVDLSEVNDETFSSRSMGDGFAIEIDGSEVVSPVNGTVLACFPTGHACAIKSDSGIEFIMHIGIDTVLLKGKGFKLHIEAGQKVKAGDAIVTVDIGVIKSYNKDLISPIIFTSGEKIQILKMHKHVSIMEKNIIKIKH
jgi:glucose-specific phosphotransferase system IIA component